MDITTFITLWMLFYGLITSDPVNGAVSHGRLQYTRTTLLQLNCGITCVTDITPQLPDFILKDSGKNTRATKRKQGKRGGVRQRFRKQRLSLIPLPPMILGNVQSLRNKVDELQGNVAFLKDFRDCCVLAFTETWLMENDQDTDLSIDGFGAPYRLDRQAEVTRKSQGGGVCLYVNRCYCTSVTVRECICTPDVELLSVSLRPFYLSREFPQLFITTVYIHPRANAASASNTIFDAVQKMQSLSPEAPHFILGDFNHVSLKKTLTNFYQYVSCPTRRDNSWTSAMDL